MFFRRNQQPLPKISLQVPVPTQLPGVGDVAKKILLVDDDPVILKALSITLKSNGYEVVTATDAAEAMSRVYSEKPDLLIVDVYLAVDPVGCGALGWDGFQFAYWLHGSNCRAPVIIMSGADLPEYGAQTTAAGARALLTKPINVKNLLATVASLISEKHPASLASH